MWKCQHQRKSTVQPVRARQQEGRHISWECWKQQQCKRQNDQCRQGPETCLWIMQVTVEGLIRRGNELFGEVGFHAQELVASLPGELKQRYPFKTTAGMRDPFRLALGRMLRNIPLAVLGHSNLCGALLLDHLESALANTVPFFVPWHEIRTELQILDKRMSTSQIQGMCQQDRAMIMVRDKVVIALGKGASAIAQKAAETQVEVQLKHAARSRAHPMGEAGGAREDRGYKRRLEGGYGGNTTGRAGPTDNARKLADQLAQVAGGRQVCWLYATSGQKCRDRCRRLPCGGNDHGQQEAVEKEYARLAKRG